MLYLLEAFIAALQLLFAFVWTIFKYTWPFWAVIFLIGVIRAIFSKGGDDYGYDSSSTSSSYHYDHENFWGVPQGKTKISNGKAEHSDFWGVYEGSSELKGDKIQHKNWYGEYNGVSRKSSDGKRIDHYGDIVDEGYVYKGHSEVKENGDIVHYDWLNREIGRSRKKGD